MYPSRLAHLHERATKRRIRYQLEFYVSELLTSSTSPEPVLQTDNVQKILRYPDLKLWTSDMPHVQEKERPFNKADDGKPHPIPRNSMYSGIFPYKGLYFVMFLVAVCGTFNFFHLCSTVGGYTLFTFA